MKLDRIIFFTLFLIVISADSVCMDKSIISYTQRTVMIPCSDGMYELAKWKVFESITLHEHCLTHDKNFESARGVIEVPLFPNVCVEEMALFSQALDVMPGALLHEHIMQKLTTEQRKKLITAAGRQDEKRIVKLNAPAFTGNLVDAFFVAEIVDTHIKPRMQRFRWINFCSNACVKNNLIASFLPKILWQSNMHTFRHENGRMSSVPECLGEGSLYNGRMGPKLKMIDDKEWMMSVSKLLDGGWEHCMTFAEPHNADMEFSKNKVLLWSINNDKKIIEKIVIEHKSAITQSCFSKNGEYLLTVSASDLYLSKITHQNDGSSFFNTQRIDCDAYHINDVYFNPQSTCFVICSYDEQKGGHVDVRDVSGNFIATIDDYYGYPHEVVWSPDGKRLLTCSLIDAEDFAIKIWDMNDLSHIKLLLDIGWRGADVDQVICSPDGIFWALATSDGKIIEVFYASHDAHGYRVQAALSPIDGENKINILYSADSRFLIALIPQGSRSPQVVVWSTLTGEKIVTTNFFGANKLEYGIGITPRNSELVFVDRDNDGSMAYTRPFIQEDDDAILSWLHKSTSVHELNLLRRLYVAHKNKNVVELYEEEPAYKALMGMQSKTLDVARFVKKYLSWNVINNKKDVIALAQEATKEVVQRMQEAWQKFSF